MQTEIILISKKKEKVVLADTALGSLRSMEPGNPTIVIILSRFHTGSGLQPANWLIVVAHQQFDQVVDRRELRLVFLAVLKAEKPDITQVYGEAP